jgi:hypothetical protein
MDPLGGGHENSGQWMMPVPKAVDGSEPPSGPDAPNILINTAGGNRYVFATWNSTDETLTPWTAPQGAPATGQVANLEGSRASWWGASGGSDNNGRMMMIGWATPDYHGDAGPGISFLTRLTGLREVRLLDVHAVAAAAGGAAAAVGGVHGGWGGGGGGVAVV